MAALTTTITSFAPVGEHVVLTGSFTGEQDDSHLVLATTTGVVFSCNIATPVEDATTAQVILNATTGGAVDTTNGSVRVSTASDTGTYTFTAHIAGAYF